MELGDNIVAPDLMLDEDYFYCRIQPEVVQAHGCAGGGAGEMGMCHTARSALRLVDTTGIVPPTCVDDVVEGGVPPEYLENFHAVQFTVQSDPLSSPCSICWSGPVRPRSRSSCFISGLPTIRRSVR